MILDANTIQKDFPILQENINGNKLVYFDNAATTQKPQVMIDELVRYYSKLNSNIHRGVHTISQRATSAFENTREYVASVYNADLKEVIFTKNDTESLNLIAYTFGESLLVEESNIVLTDAEHHSNIVPWQILKKRTNKNFEIRFAKFDKDGLIDLDDLKTKIDKNTKIVSFSWASNTFGVINPAEEIINLIKNINPEIKVVIDAAQSVPHKKFNFRQLNVDFITFSAHKLCGPTGVGILIGKEELLSKMPPFMGGGDMIKEVGKVETTFNDLPYKFEAGTPNIADVIAFKKSLEYLENIGFEKIFEYEQILSGYLINKLNQLEFVEIYGIKDLNKSTFKNKISLVSFNLKNIHAHDVGSLLDEDGIAVRSGHHCTQLAMQCLNIPASVRASLYIYNTKEEIDIMIESLNKINKIFN